MHLHLFTDHIRRADVHSTIDGTAWLELTMDEGGCLALFAREQGGLGKMDLQFIGDIINKALTDHSFEVYWAELDTLLDEAGLPGIVRDDAMAHFIRGRTVRAAFDRARAGNERVAI